MDEIKVSVIIPVYQVENYLERAVDSVLDQTLGELEIILVDDGSRDNSPEICDRYREKHPDKVRVIHKENQGLGFARNTGAAAARGRYLAFLDSDDTVEPEMYREMYEKACEGGYDIVMCDVEIIYVEEGRRAKAVSYCREEVDLPGYLARGNNITYSVNKLFRREIWEENRYEKMLFEDIALIPALVTRYPNIGYVRKAFYHYYRRADTISTTQVGEMADIVQAYRRFLNDSSPEVREEAVYCAAKQILWNMTDSRPVFQADFVELLREYRRYFLMNPYLEKDKRTAKLLEYLDMEPIPENIICVHFGQELPARYLEGLRRDFPRGRLIEAGEELCGEIPLPPSVKEALEEGKLSYAQEYASLWLLERSGGIVVDADRQACLRLKQLRMEQVFFGFEDQEQITSGCFGAQKGHYVIQALLDTYWQENIFNQAKLPLGERIRDFLMVHFGLLPNGRSQLLKNQVRVFLPSILAYDMQDGENCCKYAGCPAPEGCEVVSRSVLKMWSDRLMENWRLYKSLRDAAPGPGGKKLPAAPEPQSGSIREEQLEERLQQVAELYENSTCWRVTRPLRALGRLLGR